MTGISPSSLMFAMFNLNMILPMSNVTGNEMATLTISVIDIV